MHKTHKHIESPSKNGQLVFRNISKGPTTLFGLPMHLLPPCYRTRLYLHRRSYIRNLRTCFGKITFILAIKGTIPVATKYIKLILRFAYDHSSPGEHVGRVLP